MTIEKVRDKIRKLLELSNSSNEHEAAAAAARAADLMLKHQIAEAELEVDDDPVDEAIESIDLDDGYKAPPAWRGNLAHTIATALGCKVYYDRRICPRRNAPVRFLQVLGTTSDVQTVKYLNEYLMRELERLAVEKSATMVVRADGSPGKKAAARNRWRNSFRLGATQVIGQRLREQRSDTMRGASDKALMVIDRKLARVDAAYNSMNLSGGKRRRSSIDGDAYAAGKKAGRNVRLGGGKGIGTGPRQVGRGALALGSGKR